MSALYPWMNDTSLVIFIIIFMIFYLWVLVLLGVRVQAGSLHKGFALAPVLWLVGATSPGLTAQLNGLSGHKNCFCLGKFSLGISSPAARVTRLRLLCLAKPWCFSSKRTGESLHRPSACKSSYCLAWVLTRLRQNVFDPIFSSL